MSGDQGWRNGVTLARWQGGVDAALKSHEDRLNATAADIRATKDSMQSLHDDVREIKRSTMARTDESRFRWTKFSVTLAAMGGALTLALNLYLALKK